MLAGLLLMMGLLAGSAASTKSATYDEPFHALANHAKLYRGDFRMDYESPPIFAYWAGLANPPDSLQFDFNNPTWRELPQSPYLAWDLATNTLFRTPANNGQSFINRSRLLMLVPSLLAAAITAIWAWRLAGPRAAVIAAILFCLDPNILAHAALVKTDLFITLAFVATLMTLWHIGNRLTPLNVLALGLLLGLGMNIKFSGALLWPIVGAVLLARAFFFAEPWSVMQWSLPRRAGRLLAAASVLAFCGLISIAVTWGCYRFRFAPTSDPAISLNATHYERELVLARFASEYAPGAAQSQASTDETSARLDALDAAVAESAKTLDAAPIPNDVRDFLGNILATTRTTATAQRARLAEIQDQPAERLGLYKAIAETDRWLKLIPFWCARPGGVNDPFLSLSRALLSSRLMPAAWTHGIMQQYVRSKSHNAYFLGHTSLKGAWYYFPLAILAKSPLATLAALSWTLGGGIWLCKKRFGRGTSGIEHFSTAWMMACVVTPPAIYLLLAMNADVAIGLRYILPIYPFLFIAAGIVIDQFMKYPSRCSKIAAGLIGLSLAIATLRAWPNFLPFFNRIAGGERGGFNLLADSNLDWGQDLPALAEWQKENNPGPIALSYFGRALPSAYGVDAVLADPFHPDTPPLTELAKTYIVAISATNLQGVYPSGPKYDDTVFQQYQPIAVLGGTIYLYDLRTGK
jgi:hypothetical protein